ncbi:MAG: hypothetical protein ACE5OZ_14010 [Candidatus Heimdallarchaeota archaeon]
MNPPNTDKFLLTSELEGKKSFAVLISSVGAAYLSFVAVSLGIQVTEGLGSSIFAVSLGILVWTTLLIGFVIPLYFLGSKFLSRFGNPKGKRLLGVFAVILGAISVWETSQVIPPLAFAMSFAFLAYTTWGGARNGWINRIKADKADQYWAKKAAGIITTDEIADAEYLPRSASAKIMFVLLAVTILLLLYLTTDHIIFSEAPTSPSSIEATYTYFGFIVVILIIAGIALNKSFFNLLKPDVRRSGFFVKRLGLVAFIGLYYLAAIIMVLAVLYNGEEGVSIAGQICGVFFPGFFVASFFGFFEGWILSAYIKRQWRRGKALGQQGFRILRTIFPALTVGSFFFLRNTAQILDLDLIEITMELSFPELENLSIIALALDLLIMGIVYLYVIWNLGRDVEWEHFKHYQAFISTLYSLAVFSIIGQYFARLFVYFNETGESYRITGPANFFFFKTLSSSQLTQFYELSLDIKQFLSILAFIGVLLAFFFGEALSRTATTAIKYGTSEMLTVPLIKDRTTSAMPIILAILILTAPLVGILGQAYFQKGQAISLGRIAYEDGWEVDPYDSLFSGRLTLEKETLDWRAYVLLYISNYDPIPASVRLRFRDVPSKFHLDFINYPILPENESNYDQLITSGITLSPYAAEKRNVTSLSVLAEPGISGLWIDLWCEGTIATISEVLIVELETIGTGDVDSFGIAVYSY